MPSKVPKLTLGGGMALD